jgi:hypothetical protein
VTAFKTLIPRTVVAEEVDEAVEAVAHLLGVVAGPKAAILAPISYKPSKIVYATHALPVSVDARETPKLVLPRRRVSAVPGFFG